MQHSSTFNQKWSKSLAIKSLHLFTIGGLKLKTVEKMPVIEPYENPDLKRERATCSFDRLEITNLLDGGPDKTKDRIELGKYSSKLIKKITFDKVC